MFVGSAPPQDGDAATPPPSSDAAPTPAYDAAPTADAAPPPPSCDMSKPFGALTAVGGLGGGTYKEGARLLPAETTMYFSSNASGTVQLYVTTRPAPSMPFSTPALVGGVPTTLPTFAPTASEDGLTLVFQEQIPTGEMRLSMASRSTTSAPFDPPVALSALNGQNSSAEPYLLADASAVYFVSNRVDPKVTALYRAARAGASFASPAPVTEIALAAGERYPAVTPDDKVLYFSSTWNTQKGGADVWVARRASASDPFGVPQIVPELNSAQDDDVSWISPDGCTVYVRRGDATVGSIFVAQRP